MPRELEEPLGRAIRFLESQNFRHAVIGGIAMALWSAVRGSHGVDIKVLVPDSEHARIRTAIRAAFPKRAREHVPENPLIVAVDIEGVIVDFLLALPGYEDNIITRAVQRDLETFKIWVCSAEDLVVQKAVAGRGKDWLDVESLLIEQWGRLDEAYIEKWLAQFVKALETPEVLERYREVYGKIAKIQR